MPETAGDEAPAVQQTAAIAASTMPRNNEVEASSRKTAPPPAQEAATQSPTPEKQHARPRPHVAKQPSPSNHGQSSSRNSSTRVTRQASQHGQKTAPAPAGRKAPSPATLERFIHAYTAAYESKNFQKFQKFFTADALENDHPFTLQHDKYIRLFNAVDTLSLDINILAVIPRPDQVRLRGRFTIQLTYPQSQPISKKGKISLLLVNNTPNYQVRELHYSFDPED
jgi:hypothetical protein